LDLQTLPSLCTGNFSPVKKSYGGHFPLPKQGFALKAFSLFKKNNQRYKTTKMFTKQVREKYFYKADFITLIFDSFTQRFLVMIDKPNFPATN